MIRVATDNDFNEHVVTGWRARLHHGIEVISIRDVGLGSRDDDDVLEWAADTGHVLLSHDASTMTAAAYERLRRGVPMPGLVIVPQRLPIGAAIDRLVALFEQATREDFEGRVLYL